MENQAMSSSKPSTPKPEKLQGPAISSSSSSTPNPKKLKGLPLSPSDSSTPKPEKLKGLALSSSSSSTPKPEKLKAPIVAMEKAKEKATMNTGLKLGSPSEVMSAMRIENPSPRPEKNKALIVAMEKVKEKATMNTYLKQGSPPEVMSQMRIENPGFGSSVVRTRGDIMKLYPPKSNKIFTCPFCKKGFSTCQALGGHQNAHRQERDWEKKRKEMEATYPGLSFFNPYTDKPHILLGGNSKDSLSNENHLGITLDPFKRFMYPSFNSGVIGGSRGMNMTAVPRVTPTSFFTGSTSTNHGSSSSSRFPNPLPNNISPFSLLERNVFPTPPRTTKLSGNMVSQETVREENFISKIGTNNVVVIDVDDDDDIDLSLSL